MQYLGYNENKPRGTYDFPFEYHHVEQSHPQYHMPYHWHVEYELLRVLEGHLLLTLDERSVEVLPGDTCFIGSGTLHSGLPADCIYECIVFDMNTFLKYNDACKKSIQNILDYSILIHHHFKHDNIEIKKIVGTIFDSISSTSPGFQMSVLGGFYQFFGAIYRDTLYLTDSKQTPRDHKRIAQLKNTLALIEANFATPISLLDLAKAANMSPKYFCRFFQEMTHTSPIDYVNQFRIEHACHLLLTTQLPVTEIALSCGFTDVSYFIKLFKRYKGVTPKKYLS